MPPLINSNNSFLNQMNRSRCRRRRHRSRYFRTERLPRCPGAIFYTGWHDYDGPSAILLDDQYAVGRSMRAAMDNLAGEANS